MTRAGLYSSDELDELEYHADLTTLSSSGARTLLNKSPAEFRCNGRTSQVVGNGLYYTPPKTGRGE